VAKCDWAIVCDHAFFDEDRKMCMVGVFDRIFARAVPATHLQAFLVLKLVGEPKEKAKVRVDIVRPYGDVLGKIEGTSELGDDGTSQHIRILHCGRIGQGHRCNSHPHTRQDLIGIRAKEVYFGVAVGGLVPLHSY